MSVPAARPYPIDAFLYRYRPIDGDVIVEAGAGTGQETVDLARMVGLPGRVLAIEPHPVQATMLQEATRALSQVTVANYAVLDEPGVATLTDETFTRCHLTDGPGVTVTVETLDRLTADLPRIDLLKMNIEGSELAALRGFSEGLKRTRNAVVSCHDFMGMFTRAEVETLLGEHGFTLQRPLPVGPDDAWASDFVYGTRG